MAACKSSIPISPRVYSSGTRSRIKAVQLQITMVSINTHPCDSQAIAYLKQMSQAYADARNAYEAQYGPLRAENAKDTVYWSWTDDPWPWEGGGY